MTYYDDLTKDEKRVSIFKEAILQNAHGITYDLGTGSGILATFAAQKAQKVYAFEYNPLVIKKYAKEVSSTHNNIEFIEADVTSYEFRENPDVVICEMLDTALIDEQQALAINNVLQYTSDETIFIPKKTYDTIQVGNSNISHITYDEYSNIKFISLSDETKYNEVDFSKTIDTNFEKEIEIPVQESGNMNTILITTYTILTDDLVTGPTPMLNPPILIPIKEVNLTKGQSIVINLKYKMGGGLNTIRANTKRII